MRSLLRHGDPKPWHVLMPHELALCLLPAVVVTALNENAKSAMKICFYVLRFGIRRLFLGSKYISVSQR